MLAHTPSIMNKVSINSKWIFIYFCMLSFALQWGLQNTAARETCPKTPTTLYTWLKVTHLGLLPTNSMQGKWKGHFGRRESKMNCKLWMGFNLSGVAAMAILIPTCWKMWDAETDWLIQEPHKHTHSHTSTHIWRLSKAIIGMAGLLQPASWTH